MIAHHHDKNIIYEAQQVRGEGCCFSGIATRHRETYLINPVRTRICSEPKESKKRKIELVTPRKGLSQGKQTNHTCGSLSHQKISSQYQEKIGTPKTIVSFNYNSKVTTPKSSLKTSKIALNSNIKPARLSCERNQEQIPPCHKIQINAVSTERRQAKPQLTGFQYISEISLVSEQFISQASAANIANMISSQQKIVKKDDKNNHYPPQTLRQQIYTSCFEQKEKKTPIERMMDRKRYEVKAENRRKRIVN